MFPTGAFNPTPMAFQYPVQQPTGAIYQSQYGGFNPQVPAPFQQVPPPRGQSLPASNRQYPPPSGTYAPPSSRRHGQYPPSVPPQHYEHQHHGSKSKKHSKQRSVSPAGVADESLYSDKEKNDRSRSHSSALESQSKQEDSTNNDQEHQSQTVESTSGEIPQGNAIPTEEQQSPDEKRRSRSKKKKHHRSEHYNNQYQPPPFYGELPSQMRVHQQPLYSGYNQAYDESIRRGDVYHKQAKRSTRLPPEVKQKLLPHEDDRQKQYQYPAGYPQQAFSAMQPPFNPYQPYGSQQGFFAPTSPYNIPQRWSNVGGINGPVEQEIQRLRSHIHTLEGELNKLHKKLNKTTLNNDDNNRTHQRSKHDEVGSPRQTPVIVELNSTTGETNRESSSKKKHRHRKGSPSGNVQQGQNHVQQSGENNPEQNTSNQQQADSHERPRSNGNQITETEGKPLPKTSREETAAQLAHAAAAHVNARQQVPPPPPVQQQQQQQQTGLPPQMQQIRGQAPRFPVPGSIRYPNDPYQQHNIFQSNYNQSNNNELFDKHEERRHRRSADKILDAFERVYMNKTTTTPMKVKYIPEEYNSNHQQRNTNNNNNNNNRERSASQSLSSSTWSNLD